MIQDALTFSVGMIIGGSLAFSLCYREMRYLARKISYLEERLYLLLLKKKPVK